MLWLQPSRVKKSLVRSNLAVETHLSESAEDISLSRLLPGISGIAFSILKVAMLQPAKSKEC